MDNKTIRTRISLTSIDVGEIEMIKERHPELKNNTDVFRFLLYNFLEKEEESKEKINRIDYETMLLKYILKEMLPEFIAYKTPDEIEKEAEKKLKQRLRNLE